MKIIEAHCVVEVCPDGNQALAMIERAGRTCYKSEGRIDTGLLTCRGCGGEGHDSCGTCQGAGVEVIGPPSSHRFVRMLLERGHESVLEHASASIRFMVDRGVSHELVRHRLASFSQQSTRFCRYSDGDGEGNELTFVAPSFWPSSVAAYPVWKAQMEVAERSYLGLLSMGAKPEEARSVLPNSLKTEVVVTANFREWMHIFNLRCSPRAHPDMRFVMEKARDMMQRLVPIIFEAAA